MVAQPIFLTLALPIAVLVAGRFTVMRILICVQRTMLLSGPSNCTTSLPRIHFRIPSNVARNVKSCRHLATCVCLDTTHETPIRCFCKVPSTLPARTCLRLWMWKMKLLKWQHHPMMVSLRLRTRLSGWKIFDVGLNRHEDLLLRVYQTNDSEIPVCDISDTHLLSLVQSLRADGFYHARGALLVTTPATAA